MSEESPYIAPHRKDKTEEKRSADALERIADTLVEIRKELEELRKTVKTVVR